jgi:Mor family transcriptional regulator
LSDLITSIIDTLQQHVSAVTPELARQLEQNIRQRWGGEQIYIARRYDPVISKTQTINNELRAGHSIAQIEALHGIPRSTVYRLINQKKGDKPCPD